MSETYDIFISIDKEMKFPSYCPICLKECETKYDIKANPDGFFGYYKWLLGKTKKVSVPLHKECYKQYKNSMLKRNFLLLVIATICIPIAIWLDLTRLEAILGLAVVVVPILYGQVRNPPPIEIVKEGSEINLTVSNKKYALDLATLNGVKIQ